MSDDYDWGDEEEDDDFDECGMMPDGFCMLAGTEHCDWDCPIGSQPINAGQAPPEIGQILADALAGRPSEGQEGS